jgi:hypothetical protein
MTDKQAKQFKFELGDAAKLLHSHEEGGIIARAEYLTSENSYLFRYKAADGRQVENWWQESAFE